MRLSTAALVLGVLAGRAAALRGKATTLGLSELAEVADQDDRARRSVMADMEMEHPAFAPLPCNAPIDVADTSACLNWSEQAYDTASLVTIPCGTCVKLDAATAGTLDLPLGLNVEGKLVIPVDELGPDYAVDVRTPFVVVQGVLDIRSTRTVSPENEAVAFSMTGEVESAENVDLAAMVHAHNAAACEHMCSVGKKAFAVIGGRLDIEALPAQCPSWTRIEEIVTRPVAVVDAGAVPAPPQPIAGCDATGAYIFEDFTDNGGGWNSNWSPGGFELSTVESHVVGDQYFRAKGRTQGWMGPMRNVDPSCLVPDVLYVVKAKAKLVLTTDFAGTESSCQASGQKCLQPVYHHKEVGGTNPTWKGMGNKLTEYGGDGVWYDILTTIKFTEKEATPGSVSRLYFDGPEPGIDILLDDVSIKLATAEYFHPAGADTCSQLVVNGGADNDLPDPLYTNAGGTSLRVEEEGDGSGTNRYFSLKNRNGYWQSAETKPLLDCVVEGDVYTFSMKIRLRTDNPTRARLMFKSMTDPTAPDTAPNSNWDVLKDCPYQTEADGWVTHSVDHAITPHQAAAGLVKFYAEVGVGDDATTVDYDDISVAFMSGPGVGLQLPSDVLPCWGVGSEIMVASHTLQFDDASVKTIAAASIDAATGHAVLTLDSPVSSAVTTQHDVASNPNVALATEVALLTRNVRLESVDVADGSKLGAHMIVYHTPDVEQTLEGVAVRKFGQAGTLGKYPLHFHMSGDVDGSVLSKNVVRDSFQRCYVIHGSHNVTLADNVAFDTFGHCYFLEDSAEMGNAFLRNIGAVTRNQLAEDMITAQPETDDEASTFWMTNPMNSWEGNVAAGSEHSGFWFEMRNEVRGPSAALHPAMKPKVLPLGTFIDNVMHSNLEHGLKTYPGAGYEPDIEAVFTNTMSYRNKGSGVFFHNSRNLALEGGFYSDNRRQVDFDRAPTTRVSNAEVTGSSPLYKVAAAASAGLGYGRNHCPSEWPLVGVQLHSFWTGSDVSRGSVVENVNFHHLGSDDTGCDGSRAMNIDMESKGYFDVRTSLTGLTYDSSTPDAFETCSAFTGDDAIDFVAVRDLDGSVLVGGQPGYILSDSPRMTGLLPSGACSPLVGSGGGETCAVACPGLCVRSRLYRVSGVTPDDVSLIVTDTTDTTKSIEIPGYFEYNFVDMDMTTPDMNENTLVWRDRLFHVVVPEAGGPYEAKFVKGGQDFWPRFVEEVNQDEPGACGSTFPAIEVVEPEAEEGQCDDLIYNGDMEGGLEGWQHNGGGLAIHVQGVSGQALKSDTRNSDWNGPGQYLDTRCLVEGDVYTFEAKVKMARDSDGSDPGCTIGSGCPKAVMIVQTSSQPEVRDWVSIAWSTPSGTWSAGEWNTVTNTLMVTAEMAAAESVFVYFQDPPPGVDIILDDVSLTPYVEIDDTTACAAAAVLDADFAESVAGWNSNYSPGGFQLSDIDSHAPGDSYFWVKGRTARWHGPMNVDFDTSCLVPDRVYFLSAKVRYEFTDTHLVKTGETCLDNIDFCVQAVYYHQDASNSPHWHPFGLKTKQGPGVWFEYKAHYTFTADDLAAGNGVKRLYFDGPEAGVDIKIDDVQLSAAPSTFGGVALSTGAPASMCDELLVNGDAELAPFLPYPIRANAWKTWMTVESEEGAAAGGGGNHFFRLNDRYGNWHSAEYDLPVACITAGEVYTFSMKTRVHSAVAVRPKVIIKAEPHNEYKLVTYCPEAEAADGGAGAEWITCTTDYTWTVKQGSADTSRVKFWIEVPEDVNADVDYDDFSFVPKVSTA